MRQDRLWRLAASLLDKTKEKTLRWGSTVTRDDYQVGLRDVIIRVSRFEFNENYDYALQVFNKKSILVASIDTYDTESQSYGRVSLEQLWEEARASALNLDELLDSLESALEENEQGWQPKGSNDDDVPF